MTRRKAPTTATAGVTAVDDDGGDSDDEFVALDPCTIIPDDALTAALGSAPTPDRTSYPGSGSTLCTIESSAGDARLSIEIHTIAGRDGFEIMRGHKEGIEGCTSR